MGEKRHNKDTKSIILDNAVDAVNFTNMLALKTTEKVFDKGFEVTEKLQFLTGTLLKKGFGFTAKSQSILFNTLEDTKKTTVHTLNKIAKRKAKKAS